MCSKNKIKLLILDVDGVLTNGKVYYGNSEEMMGFHVQDGSGLHQLRQKGIIVAVISGRESTAVKRRLAELQIQHVFLAQSDKLAAYQTLLSTLQFTDEQVAYVGDDVADIPVMEKVALPIAVANAVPAAKKIAKWCTIKEGGNGAVREVCDYLLYPSHFEMRFFYRISKCLIAMGFQRGES
ncbi:MAG: hypothetical protein A3I77_00060 [Gammaproteobacteria bacterium RIFCSPLOWO2_02_FULL_42_14]|nr:MAG: hypothetical protein A3B71_00060 [Gammaproteobacteria bacterium RIFCSPHIGHO2_02_FULL_42_43]OGT27241.1 MAG: hypothetical protein A2624_02745 [Gammaproteobacteria bacterium RIFCSPHIGHO2_01_FULL_42_8]OGT51887.1 MAG: hypothetical protein A3E54_01085 [Gammaproteobacteria bacterium RIFCSPHIGHO2_12_FULL_41_25]OGT62401.1 MAG: hypothetical protein A3I77_00060 [Gammaproteobacteria bacterium RIFCSPLOWO2_02_FULL_42_14]OGT85353.1 MAG: hypothetical protein A3G86_08010 [Gammaproteobacteria bacterium R